MIFAVAEPIPVWLIPTVIIGTVFMFFWMSFVSIGLYRLSKTDRNIETMQRQLTEASDKLITERFRVVTHSVNNHAQTFTSALDAMSLHVKERDAAFVKISEANPHQELKVANALHALEREVRDSTVSKSDFDELRAEHRELQQQLARLATVEDLRRLLREANHG